MEAYKQALRAFRDIFGWSTETMANFIEVSKSSLSNHLEPRKVSKFNDNLREALKKAGILELILLFEEEVEKGIDPLKGRENTHMGDMVRHVLRMTDSPGDWVCQKLLDLGVVAQFPSAQNIVHGNALHQSKLIQKLESEIPDFKERWREFVMNFISKRLNQNQEVQPMERGDPKKPRTSVEALLEEILEEQKRTKDLLARLAAKRKMAGVKDEEEQTELWELVVEFLSEESLLDKIDEILEQLKKGPKESDRVAKLEEKIDLLLQQNLPVIREGTPKNIILLIEELGDGIDILWETYQKILGLSGKEFMTLKAAIQRGNRVSTLYIFFSLLYSSKDGDNWEQHRDSKNL